MERLGTKAETLQKLYKKLENAEVLPQFCFTVGEWIEDRECILRSFEELEWKESVAVRSSSLLEDTLTESRAGQYESVLNVCGRVGFEHAVERVIASYGEDEPSNQILVQPMLKNIRLCGVAFTMDPNTCGNYYVINYDNSGSTSGITSGNSAEDVLYYQFKEKKSCGGSSEIQKVCEALRELEEFFGQENLDVEFAMGGGPLYILQVRALCLREMPLDREIQKAELRRIEEKIRQNQQAKPFLRGKKTVYSVMTDWNPAEMIGIYPKPLALSLYREIITDSVWAYQRDNYGYRNLRSFPLMVDFGGVPYIDVRVSFNSFIPAELEEELSEKLVNYYIDRLIENPQKHDKAEFDIVFSCYTLDLPERIQVLRDYGFSEEEVGKVIGALRNVTNHIIDYKNGLWQKDYGKIETLNRRYDEIMESGLDDVEKVYWLLEDCKRYGTLPFAGLARGAFIAVQILRSLVSCEIITGTDYELFMNEVNTVSSAMNVDFRELSQKAFLKKYGHLRPGTYDIMSPRYDEAPELYFKWDEVREDTEKEKGAFRLSLQQLNDLKTRLRENGLTNDILELMDFIRTVIEGREYGKFAFTRNLSRAMQLIEEIGKKEGFSREECAFINIRTIYDLYASARDVRTTFLYSIRQGKQNYKVTQSIVLPPVITKPEDAMGFYYPDSEPNFITLGHAVGAVCVLEEEVFRDEIEGKIILIPGADPGYDWIFSHKIHGFITMYGGANSHMAIRAGELSIPAVVGAGTKAFERYKKAQMIEIDAQGKIVRVLK